MTKIIPDPEALPPLTIVVGGGRFCNEVCF